MRFSLAFLVLFTFSVGAFASEEQIFFETYSEEIEERELAQLSLELELEALKQQQFFGMKNFGNTFSVLSRGFNMMALGLDVYKLATANKPNISTKFAPIHVLPVENGKYVNPMRLTNVSRLKGRKYIVVGRSGAGLEVVRFEYTIVFQTGKHKKGRYILNAFARANTKVVWGNTLDATMQFNGMANAGSETAPVAQATLKISYKTSSLLVARETEDIIQIDALGRIARY